MKNREIFEAALALLAEPMNDERIEDYASRAPYILAGFFYENGNIDDKYREFTGLEPRNYTHAVYADLDADFPFADRFVSAASANLASLLIIDENNELGDKLFDIYSTSMTKIVSEIPASCESILNIY